MQTSNDDDDDDDDDDDNNDDVDAVDEIFDCSEIEGRILVDDATVIGTEVLSDACSSIVPPSFSSISGTNVF